MQDINFKLDSSENEFDEIFFNRPVSRIQASKVGLVTSKNVPIKTISTIYQIIESLRHRVVLVADEKQSGQILPADVILKSKKTPGYSNVDDGIYELEHCKIIIILAGKEINSSMEVFVEQLLKIFTGTLITDRPEFLQNIDFKGEAILLADSSRLIAKYDSGLNHTVNLVINYSSDYRSPVVFFKTNQIIGADYKTPGFACVINSKKEIMPEEYIGFMAGLLADKKIPLEEDWLRYCQASGFLMRMMQSEGIDVVKKYLDDKF